MKVILFANTDWYLYNFRRSLAVALRKEGHDVLLLSPKGDYAEKLSVCGLRWREVRMDRRSLNPFRELWVLLQLFFVFRQERPDVVHGLTIKCAIYAALAARAARVRGRVSSVAGMGYVFISDATRARLLRPLVRKLLRVALAGRRARIIVQNADDADLLCSFGVDASVVRLIRGSGVDCDRFRPATRTSNSLPLRVLLASRLLWDKGIGEFVDASRILRGKNSPITFMLAGQVDYGNPAAIPLEQVSAWCEQGLIEWLGHIEDMPALLSAVDVAVLPSYREGLPKGLIEAAAAGLPIITTDVPGCREVVSHEVDGLLVPARDPEALAHAISKVAMDPALASRLGEAARAKALTEFAEAIVIERTLSVYEEVLGT